jgi:hypothetical protein
MRAATIAAAREMGGAAGAAAVGRPISEHVIVPANSIARLAGGAETSPPVL